MSGSGPSVEVVDTPAQAAELAQEPLLVLEPLAAYLDGLGLGAGPIEAKPVGAGHSNVTYLLARGETRLCLRRPPRGPLPESAHDVVREARIQLALSAHGVRTPEILAVCEDPTVTGAPFYVMAYLDGHVLSDTLPPRIDTPGAGADIGTQLVDRLVELHAVNAAAPDLARFGRPDGYLERQIARFSGFLGLGDRTIPELSMVAEWLAAHRPARSDNAVVHGDYRLGNVMFADTAPPEITAILDWEMATLGDPLADVGYLTATWTDDGDADDPMLNLSPITRAPGFPDRAGLAARYGEATGRDLSQLHWYQVLALWKAAIFLENSFQRYRAGTTADSFFAGLDHGVPRLARRAWQLTRAPATSRET